MASAAYWMAVDLVSNRTAPLEAMYCGLDSLIATMPSCDEMLIIEPPPDRCIAGMAYFVPRNTPLALTSITRSHSSTVVSSMPPTALTPALLTRMSSLL